MWGKIITLVVLISLLGGAIWYFYQNMPGTPEFLHIQDSSSKQNIQEIIVSQTPMVFSNLRFNHNNLSYYIDPSCPEQRFQRMQEALSIIHNQTKVRSFIPSSTNSADILIGCSEDYLEKEKNVFIAGEGGPKNIVNTSKYNVIVQGNISLYQKINCDFPHVELHETFHVLGFDHSLDKNNLMYNVSDCSQKISQDIIDTLNIIYSQKPLADLYVSNISAVKKGRYLDFSIEVRNSGLIDAPPVILTVFSDGKLVDSFSLREIGFGAGRKLEVVNAKLPSSDGKIIEFVIDNENTLQEIDRTNNIVRLSV